MLHLPALRLPPVSIVRQMDKPVRRCGSVVGTTTLTRPTTAARSSSDDGNATPRLGRAVAYRRSAHPSNTPHKYIGSSASNSNWRRPTIPFGRLARWHPLVPRVAGRELHVTVRVEER